MGRRLFHAWMRLGGFKSAIFHFGLPANPDRRVTHVQRDDGVGPEVDKPIGVRRLVRRLQATRPRRMDDPIEPAGLDVPDELLAAEGDRVWLWGAPLGHLVFLPGPRGWGSSPTPQIPPGRQLSRASGSALAQWTKGGPPAPSAKLPKATARPGETSASAGMGSGRRRAARRRGFLRVAWPRRLPPILRRGASRSFQRFSPYPHHPTNRRSAQTSYRVESTAFLARLKIARSATASFDPCSALSVSRAARA